MQRNRYPAVPPKHWFSSSSDLRATSAHVCTPMAASFETVRRPIPGKVPTLSGPMLATASSRSLNMKIPSGLARRVATRAVSFVGPIPHEAVKPPVAAEIASRRRWANSSAFGFGFGFGCGLGRGLDPDPDPPFEPDPWWWSADKPVISRTTSSQLRGSMALACRAHVRRNASPAIVYAAKSYGIKIRCGQHRRACPDHIPAQIPYARAS